MFVVYETGQINLHSADSISFQFCVTVQDELRSGHFQKVAVFWSDSELLFSCLDKPDVLVLKRIQDQKVETLRSFYIQSSIYDFTLHPSQLYLLCLNELGRVYLYHIEMAQFRGYIEVQKGAMQLDVDMSGMFVAVSGPRRAVGSISRE